MNSRLVAAMLGLILPLWALAVAPVEVVALFKDRAMVRTAAGEHLLRVGQSSPDGVTLLSADAAGAEVSYGGERYKLTLSRQVGGHFKEAEKTRIAIVSDPLGQYRVSGSVNGNFANFLVDTGASVVAMSSQQASALGMDYLSGEKGSVQTAQGTVDSYFVTLDEIVVGGIKTHNVQAAVIEGGYPIDILLGMSFLRHVGMEERGGVLTLVQKF